MPQPGVGSMMQYLITGTEGMIRLDSYGKVELGKGDGWTVAFEQPAFDPDDVNDPIRLQAYADELAVLLRWALAEIQEEGGESVYFRLSTRPMEQPEREVDASLADAVIAGAYWLREPAPDAELAIAYCGAVAPEALAACEAIREDLPGIGILAITSPDRLHRDWRAALANGRTSLAARLLGRRTRPCERRAVIL